MKIIFLLASVCLLHANDDKEFIKKTHQQLIICITKQDKGAIEKILSDTQKPILEQVLKTTLDIEATITPTKYAYYCLGTASENLHNPYNNDRINDTILGTLACVAGIAHAIFNPGLLNWSMDAGLNMAGLIYFKDAYNNASAEFKFAHAYEIYKLLEK